MSVKRYDFDCYAFYDSARLSVNECEDGDYVLHSDYADLLTSHTALVEAVKSVLEWEYIKLVTEDHIDGDGLCRSLDALAALVEEARKND